MRTPMPSPRGTNAAGLYVDANRFGSNGAAYDSASGIQLADRGKILEILKGKISDEDLAKLDAALGGEEAMDSPPDFPGMPKTGVDGDDGLMAVAKFLKDKLSAGDLAEFVRLTRSAGAAAMDSGLSQLRRKQAMDILPARLRLPVREMMDRAARRNEADFEKRFPDAARIRRAAY